MNILGLDVSNANLGKFKKYIKTIFKKYKINFHGLPNECLFFKKKKFVDDVK